MSPTEKCSVFLIGAGKIRFMAPEFFGRRGECRFYTACCVHKWRSVWPGMRRSELSRLVMPGKKLPIPAVRLSCIACFSPISHRSDFDEILQRLFSSHAARTVKFSAEDII